MLRSRRRRKGCVPDVIQDGLKRARGEGGKWPRMALDRQHLRMQRKGASHSEMMSIKQQHVARRAAEEKYRAEMETKRRLRKGMWRGARQMMYANIGAGTHEDMPPSIFPLYILVEGDGVGCGWYRDGAARSRRALSHTFESVRKVHG